MFQTAEASKKTSPDSPRPWSSKKKAVHKQFRTYQNSPRKSTDLRFKSLSSDMTSSKADLPSIINFYMQRREQALDAEAKTKPMMNNKCSKQHPLHNQTVVHNGKIILKPNLAAVHPSLQAQARMRNLKFRMSQKSRKVIKKMNLKEQEYFDTLPLKTQDYTTSYGIREQPHQNKDLDEVSLSVQIQPKKEHRATSGKKGNTLFSSFNGGRPSRLIMKEGHP